MNKKVFFSYIRTRVPQIVTALVCLGVTALVLWLYEEPMMPVVLIFAILAVLAMIFGALSYRRYKLKHDSLAKALVLLFSDRYAFLA